MLHLRQLSLFSTNSRLPDNILNRIARHALTTFKDSSKSWFIEVRKLCQQYDLPDPLILLDCPQSKETSKSLFKKHILEYWQSKLRSDASPLSSLKYFKPEFMSLQKTHPIWSTCGSNSYEVCKAIIQARMLSGRYRTDQFLRHFTENDGSCTLCNTNDFGSIEHLLILCPALTDTRNGLLKKLNESPTLTQTTKTIIVQSFHSVDSSTQMMLDPSTTPEVISATQLEGPSILEEVFRFSRSWCYSLHKTRLKLLGRWKK